MATAAAIGNLGAYADNPRGNLWFKDESTYGHKLLMKMGWKQGKGLGKNENGIKENLSVKYRSTNSGLGYKDDPYANIMKTEYETILKNLNEKHSQNKFQFSENESKEQVSRCNQKSKVVKSRIRYPKLYFAKNVNNYSEKDMKSIFICSLPSKDKEEFVDESTVSTNKADGNEVPEATETYSSTFSISEYFAKKMEEKKNNLLKGKFNGESDNQEACLDLKEIQEPLLSNRVSKKRKNKSDVNFIHESKDDSSMQQPILNSKVEEIADSANLPSEKSSRKRIKHSPKDIVLDKAKSESDEEKEQILKKSKKKKRKLLEVVSQSNICENGENFLSKPKKLKVLENGFSSNNDSLLYDTLEDKISCQSELLSNTALEVNDWDKKHSKKKSKNISDFNAENSFQDNHTAINNCNNSSVLNIQSPSEILENQLSDINVPCIKKKKKGKKLKLKKLKSCLKSKSGSYSLKNVSFNDSVSYKIIDTDYEIFDCLVDISSIDKKNVDDGISDANSPVCFNSYISEEMHSNEELTAAVKKCEESETKSTDSCTSEEMDSDKELTEMVKKEEESEGKSTEILKKSGGGCSLLGLPSSESPHYNSWVEDQKQALKMSMYKKMLKSFKKHEILRTCNLTAINGYGNWGFK